MIIRQSHQSSTTNEVWDVRYNADTLQVEISGCARDGRVHTYRGYNTNFLRSRPIVLDACKAAWRAHGNDLPAAPPGHVYYDGKRLAFKLIGKCAHAFDAEGNFFFGVGPGKYEPVGSSILVNGMKALDQWRQAVTRFAGVNRSIFDPIKVEIDVQRNPAPNPAPRPLPALPPDCIRVEGDDGWLQFRMVPGENRAEAIWVEAGFRTGSIAHNSPQGDSFTFNPDSRDRKWIPVVAALKAFREREWKKTRPLEANEIRLYGTLRKMSMLGGSVSFDGPGVPMMPTAWNSIHMNRALGPVWQRALDFIAAERLKLDADRDFDPKGGLLTYSMREDGAAIATNAAGMLRFCSNPDSATGRPPATEGNTPDRAVWERLDAWRKAQLASVFSAKMFDVVGGSVLIVQPPGLTVPRRIELGIPEATLTAAGKKYRIRIETLK